MESRPPERLATIAKTGEPSEAIRAAEILTSRVLGKPKETVETVEKPLALQAVEEMTPEELAELWRQIEAAEQDD